MKQLLIAALILLAACNTNKVSLDMPFHPYEWAKSQVDVALETGWITQEVYEYYLEEVDALDYTYEFDNDADFKNYVMWIIYGDYDGWDDEVLAIMDSIQ